MPPAMLFCQCFSEKHAVSGKVFSPEYCKGKKYIDQKIQATKIIKIEIEYISGKARR